MIAAGTAVLGCRTAIRYNTALNVTGFRFAPPSTLAVRYPESKRTLKGSGVLLTS